MYRAVRTYNLVALICAGVLAGQPMVSFGQSVAPAASSSSEAPSTAGELQPLVDKLISEADLSATVCIYVEDSASGAVLADVNGEKPLSPASNNKLVTTAAALTMLGPDHKFVTKFIAAGPIQDGVLKGNLVIYGGGDPTISGRFQDDKMDVTAILRGWADKLKAAGIQKIDGDIVADDSYFDNVYFHPNWYKSERGEWYSAEVSALAFNDNCVDISWTAKGLLPGAKAGYELNPETSYVDFTNNVTVAAKGRETERYYNRGADDNNIQATGTLTVETTNLDSAAVHDGALYCATVFDEVLKKKGIEVTGEAVKERGAAAKDRSAKVLFEYESPSLLTVCEIINLRSQNFYSECVAKALGKESGGEGSWDTGTRIIEEFCKREDIFSDGHNAVDGSGLAAENRVTGRQLVEVLRYMDNHGLKKEWRGTLPIGGERGSLKGRFQETEEGREADSRIYGKTGLIGGVRSLSGIVTDSSGREMYYSIILNQLGRGEASKGMKLIDTVAIELARSRR